MRGALTGLLLLSLAVGLMTTAGCGPRDTSSLGSTPAEMQPVALGPAERLRAVATTSIVGDVVQRVGGARLELVTLMPKGADPHSYAPTPADSAAIYDAHVVFANGAGLETFLDKTIHNAGGSAIRVELADSLELRALDGHAHDEEGASSDEGDLDPHVWFDVQNVVHWTQVVEQTLSTLDPAGEATYQANAAAYRRELEALDAWIVAQVSLVPAANRKLVINHPSLGYFAARYGFEQIGAVYLVNPAAEPSAADLAALETTIQEMGVPAVFAENTVSPKLAEQVSYDTGIRLVILYTGSLGAPGSGADTYIGLMTYDVQQIVEALR